MKISLHFNKSENPPAAGEECNTKEWIWSIQRPNPLEETPYQKHLALKCIGNSKIYHIL